MSALKVSILSYLRRPKSRKSLFPVTTAFVVAAPAAWSVAAVMF
jgi:hypothetical protein